MKRIILPIVLALALAGCAQMKNLWDGIGAISGTTVSGQTVLIAAKTFDGVEIFATNYLSLRRCASDTRPICRESSATPIIKGAIQSGRIARNNLKTQLRAACAVEFAATQNCTAGIPIVNYNTLVAATNTIKDATAAYRAATNQ